MTRQRIAGHIFIRDGESRLTVRPMWWTYFVGCVLAIIAFVIGVGVIYRVVRDPTVYVGGTRSRQGTPIPWARQTWSQRTELVGCTGLWASPLLVVSVLYVFFGSHEHRHPLIVDRSTGLLRVRKEVCCKLSDVLAIRLVESPGGSSRRFRNAPATRVFIMLRCQPRAVQIGGFSRFATAETFAQPIADFMGVGLYDDPIQKRPETHGFPVDPVSKTSAQEK